jgi:hypothetical protein
LTAPPLELGRTSRHAPPPPVVGNQTKLIDLPIQLARQNFKKAKIVIPPFYDGGGRIDFLPCSSEEKQKTHFRIPVVCFTLCFLFQTRAYLILDTPERHFQQQQHENEKNDVDDDDVHPHESGKNFFLFCFSFLVSTKDVWENRNERKKRITETKSRKKTHTHTHRRRHTHTS